MATRPSMVIRIRKCFEIPMTSKSIMTFGKPKERWSNRFRRKMKENEMLLKNRRSDSNLFRQKSDCDCTLKTFKKTFLFHQFELFFTFKSEKPRYSTAQLHSVSNHNKNVSCLKFLLFVPQNKMFEFSRKKYTGANVFIFGAKIHTT